MRDKLEAAINAEPENRSHYLVYADWLSESGDPRGELMSVQVALEEGRSDGEREQLLARERALLGTHARTWLGPLAPLLLDRDPNAPPWPPQPGFTFRRGFLDSIDIPEITPPWVEALRGAGDVIAKLRMLAVRDTDYDTETDGATLAEVGPLPSVRVLQFGGADGDNTHARGRGLEQTLPNLPNLEELYIEALSLDGSAIFPLSLPKLRAFRFYHSHNYPLDMIAANPSLRGLETLELQPHGLEPGDGAYLTLESMEALVKGKLPLRRLQYRLSTLGDAGFRVLWESSLMATLEDLDLSQGCITDEGVRAFVAAGAGVRPRLKRLELTGNGLTDEGKKLLGELGITVEAKDQYADVLGEEQEFLWYGSPE